MTNQCIQQFDRPEELKLWQLFQKAKENDRVGYHKIKTYLFNKYYDFVLREARAFYKRTMPDNPSIDINDAESEAAIALLQCIDRYDIAEGVRFEIYCRSRIRGQIIDALRTLQYFPREIASNRRNINPKIEKLAHSINKKPTYQDILDYYGPDDAALYHDKLLESAVFNQPINQLRKQEVSTKPTSAYRVKQKTIKSKELTSILLNLIYGKIKDRLEQSCLMMYFIKGYNYKDISIAEGISISTISNKINSGREKLRLILKNSKELKEYLQMY